MCEVPSYLISCDVILRNKVQQHCMLTLFGWMLFTEEVGDFSKATLPFSNAACDDAGAGSAGFWSLSGSQSPSSDTAV